MIARLIATVFFVIAAAAPVGAEPVTFDGAAWQGAPLRLEGSLLAPAGDGPFPAVVLLHGCSGRDAHHESWASRLNDWGYVALIVDSFAPRGVDNVCGYVQAVSVSERLKDAYAAKDFLAALPVVDGARIAVMGWSHGGWALLKAVGTSTGKATPFQAAVAFYPWCSMWMSRVNTPTLILIGESDDWTPAARCTKMKVSPSAVHPVTIEVYPGATHSFDRVGLRVDDYFGHRLHHDPAATAAAVDRTEAFLARYMK